MTTPIDIEEPHRLNRDDALRAVSALEGRVGGYGVKVKWEGFVARLTGPGLRGVLTVGPASIALHVEMDAWLATVVKPAVLRQHLVDAAQACLRA